MARAAVAVEGERYALPNGATLEVQSVRRHARGFRVHCIELSRRDLFPRREKLVAMPHERFCRLCGVRR